LPNRLQWHANLGSIDETGQYTARTQNGSISVIAGTLTTSTLVTVGTHDVALPFASNAHFGTIPRNGTGSVAPDPSCANCTQLSFSIGPGERAAYALTELPLPNGAIGVAFDVRDDGNGARLRVALRNAINEQVLVTAGTLNKPGWRHVVARFPAGLAQPARL